MYAAKVMAENGELEDGLPSKKAKSGQPSVLADERFQNMFEDPAFAIDQGAEEYKVLHPNAGIFPPRSTAACQPLSLLVLLLTLPILRCDPGSDTGAT